MPYATKVVGKHPALCPMAARYRSAA